MISIFLISLISLYTPLTFSFDINDLYPKSKYFELILDVWFLIEFTLNFFTAYHEDGHLEAGRRNIARNYLRNWFAPDLVGSIPFSIFEFTEGTQSLNISAAKTSTKLFRMLKLVRYLKLLRIVRIIKTSKWLDDLDDHFSTESSNFFFKFVKIFIVMFFVSHWNACLFYSVGQDCL